jgi:hypothetical protein
MGGEGVTMVKIKTEVTNKALSMAMFSDDSSWALTIIEDVRARPLDVIQETTEGYIVKHASGRWMIPKNFCETY